MFYFILAGDITAFMEPPHIPIVETYIEGKDKDSGYINVKLRMSPASDTSKMYKYKLVLFKTESRNVSYFLFRTSGRP